MKAGGRNPVDISQGRKKAQHGDSADGQAPEQEKTGPVAIPRTAAGFLERIALGDSIKGACAAVGVTVAAYEKWRERFARFPEAVEAAREQHQQWVRCGLMEDDAFAMQLLSRIMRDENQPVLRRQRAATQILNRKGKRDWVPEGIPAGAQPLRPWGGFVEVDECAAGEDAETGSGVRDPGSGGKLATLLRSSQGLLAGSLRCSPWECAESVGSSPLEHAGSLRSSVWFAGMWPGWWPLGSGGSMPREAYLRAR
jgi:hypothetical protein